MASSQLPDTARPELGKRHLQVKHQQFNASGLELGEVEPLGELQNYAGTNRIIFPIDLRFQKLPRLQIRTAWWNSTESNTTLTTCLFIRRRRRTTISHTAFPPLLACQLIIPMCLCSTIVTKNMQPPQQRPNTAWLCSHKKILVWMRWSIATTGLACMTWRCRCHLNPLRAFRRMPIVSVTGLV